MKMNKKMAIIGGNGFIGHNVVRSFIEKYEILVIDRKVLAKPLKNSASEVKTVLADIQDKNRLHNILEEFNPHFVLNLAAKSTIQECFRDPEGAYRDNVLGNLNVLMSCLQLQKTNNANFEKLIVHSSDKAYGEHPIENLPYHEDHPHYSGDIYSTSKATQDMMTIAWAKHLGLSACVVRSGNIYGPGDLNITRLIPKTVCRLLQKKPPILYQKSLFAVRDFVFIEDLINGYDILFQKGVVGEAYNVGGSGPMKIEEAIQIIKETLFSKDIENEIIPSEIPEIHSQYLNVKKLEQLDWTSKTTFRAGIVATVPFFKKIMEDTCLEC